MKSNKIKTGLVALGLLFVTTGAQANDAGAALYKSCVGCHGAKGEGLVGPRLAGKDAAVLKEKLHGYKDDKHYGPLTTMMAPSSKKLSEADIDAVVAYIATF